jgi:hypothetical protein
MTKLVEAGKQLLLLKYKKFVIFELFKLPQYVHVKIILQLICFEDTVKLSYEDLAFI